MTTPLVPPVTIHTGAVPDGQIADFLTGRSFAGPLEDYVARTWKRP